MKFYNIKKILEFINTLKQKKAEGISVFTALKRMLIFFFLYIFITAIVAMIIIFSLNKNNKIVVVPNVVNLDFEKAYLELHKLGLNVDVELKSFNNIEKGKVAFQSIQPLRKVKQGRVITLIVSLGQTSEKREEILTEPQMYSYLLNFKLPEMYTQARVKILIDDEKEKDKPVFDNIITSNEEIKLPLKLYGKATAKIFIDEKLYIEKPLE